MSDKESNERVLNTFRNIENQYYNPLLSKDEKSQVLVLIKNFIKPIVKPEEKPEEKSEEREDKDIQTFFIKITSDNQDLIKEIYFNIHNCEMEFDEYTLKKVNTEWCE